jgi:Na+/H+-dicarboxylate symporter
VAHPLAGERAGAEATVNKNFLYVMIGLLLGIVLGTASYYSLPDKATAAEVAKYMSLVSSVFLKLIKMIIGPLVLSTLVVGIGHMGDAATVGRVGAKTMGWFVSASIVSLLLGLFMVDLLQPGVGITIADHGTNTANLQHRQFYRSSGADLDFQIIGRRRNPADCRVFGVCRRRDHGDG